VRSAEYWTRAAEWGADVYTSFNWTTLCEQVAKLHIERSKRDDRD
jgi:hypothetical protein